MKLIIKHFFDASHQLSDTEHLVTKACARLHGHTYAVKVELEGDNLRGGMLVDFKAVKQIIDVLDHRHINDVFKEHFFKEEATAENTAKFISLAIEKELGFKNTVWICEGYKGAEKASWAIYSNLEN